MKLRTQEEIISSWTNRGKIVISVCCTTFNHQDYIGTALDSFLMQETEFPYEIIVRDDCSTDSTATIIKGYVEKYPNIIKPIYETENQFSKGVKPMSVVFKHAMGEFFAVCEGDDYWTDPFKLQKQFEVFRKDPEVSICFHPAIEIDVINKSSGVICQHFPQDQIVPIVDVILGRGGYIPTVSIMFKRQQLDLFYKRIKYAPIGDYFLQMYLATLGNTYYLKEPMCVYRRNTANSWTKKQLDVAAWRAYSREMVVALDRFSPVLKNSKQKKALYQVIKIYFISIIENTHGLMGKLTAARGVFVDLYSYKQLYFKLGLILSVLKRL